MFSETLDSGISFEWDLSVKDFELMKEKERISVTRTVASLYPSFVASDTCSSCVWALPGGHFCQLPRSLIASPVDKLVKHHGLECERHIDIFVVTYDKA